MKKLLISLLIVSLILVACGDTKNLQESDSTADTKVLQESDNMMDNDVPKEMEETIEVKPVLMPDEEEIETEEVTDETEGSSENVAETEISEIPESDRGTNTYSTYVPQVAAFEISDDRLTVVSDDGSRFNWGAGEEFSISYPIAEDCIWETGYFAADFVVEDTTDFESVKSYIEDEQAGYIEGLEMEDFEISSPMGIYIEVTDGIVVRVYTVFS